ncbi:unnamed protein product [Agarophyton chilense]
MSLFIHPNVVDFLTAFVKTADLWILMQLLTGSSVNDLMALMYTDRLKASLAVYVLHCASKALEYLYGNGQMHNYVNTANLFLYSQVYEAFELQSDRLDG